MKTTEKGTEFKITDAHIKLAQRMYVGWCGDEYGAPEIDPKRPYGNSDVERDIMKILGLPIPEDGDVPETMSDYIRKLHESMEVALQIFLVTQKFEVGTYQLTEDYDVRSWEKSK